MAGHLVQMKASVSAEARDKLDHLCTEEGVTLGAMIEAFTEHIVQLRRGEWWSPYIGRAREVAAERRRRPTHQDPPGEGESGS